VYYVYRQCAVALLAISKGYLVMANKNKTTTTNPTAGMVAMPAATAANKGAAIAWAKAQGLPSFSALVIGNGPKPTNVPNPHTTAGKRKAVLANNAMAGQTVAAYYKAAQANVSGTIAPNNPLMAAKAGLITLYAPKQ
jgi:hypothetical protein